MVRVCVHSCNSPTAPECTLRPHSAATAPPGPQPGPQSQAAPSCRAFLPCLPAIPLRLKPLPATSLHHNNACRERLYEPDHFHSPSPTSSAAEQLSMRCKYLYVDTRLAAQSGSLLPITSCRHQAPQLIYPTDYTSRSDDSTSGQRKCSST
jgi:hypothetical protein